LTSFPDMVSIGHPQKTCLKRSILALRKFKTTSINVVINGAFEIIDGSRQYRTALIPIKDDAFAEYRDWDYFKVLRLEQLQDRLKYFWPNGGPQ
jgi:hypothetical protein